MTKKLKFLIIDDENDILELLTLYLEGIFDQVDIIRSNSGKQAIEIIDTDNSINCIICDFNMPLGKGDVVLNHLFDTKKNIPFYLCTAYDYNDLKSTFKMNPSGIFQKPFNMEDLKKGLDNLLEENVNISHETKPLMAKDYCKISPSQLIKMVVLPADIYVKLNNEKFVKVMSKGDLFEGEDQKHYEAKNIQFLYVKDNEFMGLVKDVQDDLEKFNKLSQTAESDPLAIPTAANTLVREFYQKFGMTEEVQKVVRDSVDITMRTIRKQPQLRQLFKKLKQNEGHYLSNHSIMLAHVSCALAAQMQWVSPSTYQKLSMAAFIHDLALDDIDLVKTLILNKRLKVERGDLLKNEELNKYHNHPLKAAEVLRNMNEPLPDVHIIIAQHHELPDGTGFPHQLNALNIFPLSAVFIMAHDLIDCFLGAAKDIDVLSYVNSLDSSYHRGNFKAVVKAIAEMKF